MQMTEKEAAHKPINPGLLQVQLRAPSYSNAAPEISCLPQLRADALTLTVFSTGLYCPVNSEQLWFLDMAQ